MHHVFSYEPFSYSEAPTMTATAEAPIIDHAPAADSPPMLTITEWTPDRITDPATLPPGTLAVARNVTNKLSEERDATPENPWCDFPGGNRDDLLCQAIAHAWQLGLVRVRTIRMSDGSVTFQAAAK